MVFSSLKGLFGTRSEATQAVLPPGPFGLGLGRAVALDLLRLRLETSKLAMRPPPETLVITGHGVASLDAAGVLHRFYDDRGTMLQILCSGGTDDASIREITVYHEWDEFVPASAAEWAVWDGPGARIGAAMFEADGFRFERVWGEPATPWIEPAAFTEEVMVGGEPKRLIHQKIVPYRREVGSLIESLLLAIERDLSSQDRGSVTFMIGYGLAHADVNPV